MRTLNSAWHSVLLAEALEKAGVKSSCRIGPQVGTSPEADNAAIADFLRRQLFNQKMRFAG